MDDREKQMLDAQMSIVKQCNRMMDAGMQPPEVAATLMAVGVKMYHSFLTKDEFENLMDAIKDETVPDMDDEQVPTMH